MKKILLIIGVTFLSITMHAQDDLLNELDSDVTIDKKVT
jgi:hypothetical protein